MRIFKTKFFSKWAKKNLISDEVLKQAAIDVFKGNFEVDLGGYVLKKRIASKGRGKSGSTRIIVAFKKSSHCFFIYGFEKNERDNITLNEKQTFKIVAKELLSFEEKDLNKRIGEGKLLEVNNEEQK